MGSTQNTGLSKPTILHSCYIRLLPPTITTPFPLPREEREKGLAPEGRNGRGEISLSLSSPDQSKSSMGKKRKSTVASRLDEVDRTMYSTFCSAANSLSHLYTQAMSQQKVSFQAGERHALEKLYQWILRQHEQGSRVTSAEIVSYLQALQNEIDCGEDTPVSPRIHFQHHHSQPATFQTASLGIPNSSAMVGQQTSGPGLRPGHSDQAKNMVFSNALSSPVRRTLQTFQFSQGDACYPNDALSIENGAQSSEISSLNQNPDTHSLGCTDASMDMRSDSPHESY